MPSRKQSSSSVSKRARSPKRVSWAQRVFRVFLWGGLALVFLLVAAAVWGFVWGPEFAQDQVRTRLSSLGDRLGYDIALGGLELPDKTRIVLRDVRVDRSVDLRPAHKDPLLTIPKVVIHLDLLAALTRRVEINRVEIFDPTCAVLRLEDGRNDIEPLLKRIRDRLNAAKTTPPKAKSGGLSSRIARKIPEIQITRGRLLLHDKLDVESAPKASHPIGRAAHSLKSPLREVSNISLTFVSPNGDLGYGSHLTVSGALHAAESSAWTLPETIALTAKRVPPEETSPEDTAEPSKFLGWTLQSTFEPPISVPSLPRFDRFGLSIGGVVLDNVQVLKLRDLQVTNRDQTPPLLHAKELDISTNGLPPEGLSKLSVRDMTLRKATFHLISPSGEGMDPRVILRRLLGQARSGESEHSAPPEDREVAVESALQRLRIAPKRVFFEDSVVVWERSSKKKTPIVWKLSELTGHLEHALLEHSLITDLSFQLHDDLSDPQATPFENHVRLHGSYGYRSQDIDAHAVLKGVNMQAATERLEIEKAAALKAGWVSGKVGLKNQKNPKTWTLDLDIEFHKIHVFHTMLSSHDVKDVDAKISGSISWAPDVGNLVLNRGRFTLEDAVTIQSNIGLYGIGHGHKRAAADFKEFKLRVAMAKTSAQDIFDAIPEGMRPALEGMRLKGDVGFTLDVDADARNLRNMKTKSNVDLDGFAVTAWNKHANVRRMHAGFSHSVTQPETGYVFTISDSDENWTPLPSVSPYFIKAIRTNEDGSFYSHHGFSWKQVKSSIERNVREGRFVRGASTVSMQVVKNIFLSHKKTVARKLQEAFLTFLMEQVEKIPKNRILEIYANIVELGPRVYGIQAAAEYYFGRRARTLTIPQAVFLVSILPGPRKYHAYYERGWITEGWWQRMKRLIDVMLDRNHITEEEHAIAIERKPHFSKRKKADEGDDEQEATPEKTLEDPEDTADGAARGALFGD